MTVRARRSRLTAAGSAIVMTAAVALVAVPHASGESRTPSGAAHPNSITGASAKHARSHTHTVSLSVPARAKVAKRVVKVRFSPKHPSRVKLQKLKHGHFVTVKATKNPKGSKTRFVVKHKRGRSTMRAVALWPGGRRATSPAKVTQWGPAPATPTTPIATTPTATPTPTHTSPPSSPTPTPTVTTPPTPVPGALDANGDPTANIPEPAALDACWSGGPTAIACVNAAVAAINLGRAREGLAAFVLPTGWSTLTPAQQLLVITNNERSVRGLRPISALSPSLNSAAAIGAAGNADPTLSGWVVDGRQAFGWASNWAITPGGPLYSHFLWMYDDGIGAGNIDCTVGHTSGCWGHRHNILAWGDADASTILLLGAAEATTQCGGTTGLSDATLLVKVAA